MGCSRSAVRPELILADEPTGNLDTMGRKDADLVELRLGNITIILITMSQDRCLRTSIYEIIITAATSE